MFTGACTQDSQCSADSKVCHLGICGKQHFNQRILLLGLFHSVNVIFIRCCETHIFYASTVKDFLSQCFLLYEVTCSSSDVTQCTAVQVCHNPGTTEAVCGKYFCVSLNITFVNFL